MNRTLLATAICAGLCMAGGAYAQTSTPAAAQAPATAANKADPPQTTATNTKTKPEELQPIIVTGSLIPTAEIDTASPVITISAQTIKQRGFQNIDQALRALPLVTGQTQGEQFGSSASFTPGIRTLSLLGLQPNFTLIMIDGHPLTSYPVSYNGETTVTNISSIPINLIQAIQVVPGGNSSIYGSAAIAGVVNFILKKHMTGVNLNYKAGGYQKGGGTFQQLGITGGVDHGRFDMDYGLQLTRQQSIWAFQRPFTASTFGNPVPTLRGLPDLVTGVLNAESPVGAFLDPDTLSAQGCAPLASSYGNRTARGPNHIPTATPFVFTTQGAGYYCGTPYDVGYQSLQPQTKQGSGYLRMQYKINDDMTAYGSLLYSVQSTQTNLSPDFNFWEPNVDAIFSGGTPGVIFNQAAGQFQEPIYSFTPQMAGSIATNPENVLDKEGIFWGGIKGAFGNSDWQYNAFYARSQDNVSQNFVEKLTVPVDDFFQNMFLGPQLGTTSGLPIYNPNYNKFFQSITPAQYRSFTGFEHNSSESYTQNVNFQFTNSDVFSLPAGPVGFAGVLKIGDERYTEPLNVLAEDHTYWGEAATSASGKRNDYAAVMEFRVPITSMLTSDFSYREERFQDAGGLATTRPTYKISLAFRPLHTLLMRANYATAFRMPPMTEAFAGPSTAFQEVTDYYQCERQHPGTPFSECPDFVTPSITPDIGVINEGNPNLAPIQARSWGGGVVWSPSSDYQPFTSSDFEPFKHFNISADYYDVRIRNEIQFQNTDEILQQDAQCLLGQLPADSTVCQDAESAVSRAGPNAPVPFMLNGITVHPINVARERVHGIIAKLHYGLDLGRFGDLGLDLAYNVTLNHTLQQGANDPVQHLLHNPFLDAEFAEAGTTLGPEFKSIGNASLTYTKGIWGATFSYYRYGSLPNNAEYTSPGEDTAPGAGTLPPWMIYNATVTARLTPDLSITGTVDNLFNKMPPFDPTYEGWPYYDQGAYNVWGRSYFIDMDLHI